MSWSKQAWSTSRVRVSVSSNMGKRKAPVITPPKITLGQFLQRAEAKEEQSKSKSEQASCTLSGGTEVAASAMSPMPGAVGGVGSSPASSTLGGGVEEAPALVQTTVATGPSAGASVPMVPKPIHEHGIDDDDEAMPLVCDVDTCDGEEALPLPGKKRQRWATPLEAKLRSPGSGDDDELLSDLDDALTCRISCCCCRCRCSSDMTCRADCS